MIGMQGQRQTAAIFLQLMLPQQLTTAKTTTHSLVDLIDIGSCRQMLRHAITGGLAQLVERVLSMHEVSGSIPEFSILLYLFLISDLNEKYVQMFLTRLNKPLGAERYCVVQKLFRSYVPNH